MSVLSQSRRFSSALISAAGRPYSTTRTSPPFKHRVLLLWILVALKKDPESLNSGPVLSRFSCIQWRTLSRVLKCKTDTKRMKIKGCCLACLPLLFSHAKRCCHRESQPCSAVCTLGPFTSPPRSQQPPRHCRTNALCGRVHTQSEDHSGANLSKPFLQLLVEFTKRTAQS